MLILLSNDLSLRIELYNHLLFSRVVAGNKNSPRVFHACLKRPLKWIPRFRRVAGLPCRWEICV